jgi:transketolase
MALAAKYLDRLPSRVWVLCGDSEMAEGSQWEAFEHAAHYELDNLTAILDINRLGQRGETMVGWDLDIYRDLRARVRLGDDRGRRARRRGDRPAYTEAAGTTGKPTVVIARTIKGKGVKAVENQPGWHGRRSTIPTRRSRSSGGSATSTSTSRSREARRRTRSRTGRWSCRATTSGRDATRKAYGDALAALGSARGDVVALDGEVSNSTFAEIFGKAHPERYFEMYIAEQQMVARGVGLQRRGWNRSRRRSRRSCRARTTSSAWRRSAARTCGSRLARRRVDRRGRPVADGARGHRLAARRPLEHGAAAVRREPDGEARRGDGRHRGHRLPAHARAEHAR